MKKIRGKRNMQGLIPFLRRLSLSSDATGRKMKVDPSSKPETVPNMTGFSSQRRPDSKMQELVCLFSGKQVFPE